MPPKYVKTVRDLLFFQYSKIIAKKVYPDKEHWGFITSTWKKLVTDEMEWSNILREDKQQIEAEKKCIYCGSEEHLSWDHIVPRSLSINEKCATCEHIQAIHNFEWACSSCNSKKGTKGLYHFLAEQHPLDDKFYDKIPPLLEKKYLKTIYNCHTCAGTLTKSVTSVLDLDF